MKLLALALSAALALGGCQTLTNLAQSTTTATPQQATTLGQAAQLADIATVATDKYVTSSSPNLATVQRLQQLRAAVRKAMDDLVAANMKGQSLTFAALNAAYSAFTSYASTNGVAL